MNVRRLQLYLGGVAALLTVGVPALAQAPVLEEVRTLTRGPEAVVRDFDVAAAGVYRLTLTDLEVPARFDSLKAAVTRGDVVVATLAAPGSVDVSATTSGEYTLRVVGVPRPSGGAGSFGVQLVNPSAGNVAVLEFAEAFSNPPPLVPPNRSALDSTFEITAAGNYEVSLVDHAFPATLSTLTLAIVRDGGSTLEAQLAAAGTTSFAATPGRYRVLAIGESSAVTNAGAFSVRVREATSSTLLFSQTEPIGLVRGLTLSPLAAGTHTLTLSDLEFPAPLTTRAALITRQGQLVARRDTPGSVDFTAVAGAHDLWVLAVATASLPGSFGIEVRQGATAVLSVVETAAATGPASATRAFNYVIDIPAAGSYRLRLADYQFPQAFVAAGFAATQNGALLDSLNTAGTLTLDNVAAGKLFVVALAQPGGAATPSGLFGIDLVSTTAGAAPLLERTEAVGTPFFARTVNITTAGDYDAAITDLRFPAQFSDFAAVVTRGADRIGSVFGGGTFSFAAIPGNYIVNVIAQPSSSAVYGTYGLRVAARAPAPALTFTTDAASVTNGGTAMLTWSTTNATACTATGGWSGARSTSGTERTAAITTSTTFTLNCDGPGGQGSASVTVSPQAVTNPDRDGGGGGRIDVLLLLLLVAVLIFSRRRATLLALFALSSAAAWAGDNVAAAVAQSTTPAPVEDRAYRIQPGDVLTVAVWKEQELQGDILVRPDGGISFPLAGDLAAGGRTVVELSDALAEKLGKYIPDPVVTVAVKSIGGNRVYVLGKVNRPGEFAFSRPLDVMQALALAGGATPYAAVNDIRILRRNGEKLVAVEFHYAEVERGRELRQNILLLSGDTVVVP